MLLFNYGLWGVPGGGQMRVIPIYSQLVEIETKSPAAPRTQPAPPRQTPVEEKKPDPPPREEVEALAQTTELTQEEPASREVPPPEPEREEVVPPSQEEKEDPVEQKESIEEEVPVGEELEDTGEEGSEEPGEPPLPPLGDGAGMLGSYLVTYHKDLLHEGIEGNVRLNIFVAEDGSFFQDPEIIVSSGHPRLDEHCLLSVKMNWRFRPAPKPYRVVVEVSFVKTDPQPQIRFLGEATYYSPEGGELE